MRDDVFDGVGVAGDGEIEPPVAVYARLPDLLRLVVPLVQRGVLEVALRQREPLRNLGFRPPEKVL